MRARWRNWERMMPAGHRSGSVSTRKGGASFGVRGPIFALVVVLAVLVAGTATAAEERPSVVVSFTVLADLTRQVAGDRVDVVSLTPVGAEVHEWELQPRNFQDLERADLVLYNGYNLEQWLRQVEATVPSAVRRIALAEESGYPTRPIRVGDFEGEPDPHLWMDPRAASAYIEVIAAALVDLDPSGADHYRSRAAAYQASLAALHDELTERFAALSAERRLLITSEAAFLYLADAYGFRHDGIWGSNAEQEGAPRQLMRVVDWVKEVQPGAIFWESTISDRYVRSVARETESTVAGPLYVDSLSRADGPAGDYIRLMRHNADLIVRALGDD